MKCPVCAVDLKIAERQGVEIDYCPQCRGVWLDRGELDKIIERSATASFPREPEGMRPREQPYRGHPEEYRKHKRKSFLGELFDF